MWQIEPIRALTDNYIWAIIHPERRICAIVDASEAKPVIKFLADRALTLKAILITHHHWDHTAGLSTLKALDSMPKVYGPAQDGISGLDYALTDQARIHLPELALTFHMLSIPGHTKGHAAYWGHDWLFTGDTLFTAGCGRVFEGTLNQMWDSLSRLAALSDLTKIYCGHEYTIKNLQFALTIEPSNLAVQKRLETCIKQRERNEPSVPATLALEKQTNPFLRCAEPAFAKAVSDVSGKALSDPKEVFSVLRHMKDQF